MLVLSRAVYDGIVAHAREGAPAEVCGVLGGTAGDPDLATRFERVPNVAADPRRRYELDPEAHLGAMETVEADGDDVVGFYHSHPGGPPAMSATDERRASWPGHVYALVDLGGAYPFVGAWRWTSERFRRAAVDVQTSARNPT